MATRPFGQPSRPGSRRGWSRQRETGGGLPDDPIAAAARAFLLGLPDAGELIDAAAQVSESEVLRARSAELARAVEELTAELSALRRGAADGGAVSSADRRRPAVVR